MLRLFTLICGLVLLWAIFAFGEQGSRIPAGTLP